MHLRNSILCQTNVAVLRRETGLHAGDSSRQPLAFDYAHELILGSVPEEYGHADGGQIDPPRLMVDGDLIVLGSADAVLERPSDTRG